MSFHADNVNQAHDLCACSVAVLSESQPRPYSEARYVAEDPPDVKGGPHWSNA
jgi:hypothetical protein